MNFKYSNLRNAMTDGFRHQGNDEEIEDEEESELKGFKPIFKSSNLFPVE